MVAAFPFVKVDLSLAEYRLNLDKVKSPLTPLYNKRGIFQTK